MTCIKAQSGRQPQAPTRDEGPGWGKRRKWGWSRGAGKPTCSRRRNIRESLGDKAGARAQGAGGFCVEGGTVFLLLIVPGARIPSPHCRLPWALEGCLWPCQCIFSPPVSGTKHSERQCCALGSWLQATLSSFLRKHRTPSPAAVGYGSSSLQVSFPLGPGRGTSSPDGGGPGLCGWAV